MGSACSCGKSSEETAPGRNDESHLSKEEKNVLETTSPITNCELQNGVVSHANCDKQNGDVSHALREAKDLLSEARKSTRLSIDAGQPEMAADLQNLVTRLESAVSKLEHLGVSGVNDTSLGGAPDSKQSQANSNPFVIAYDDLIAGPLRVFLDCSKQIGGDVASISKLVESLFATQRTFIAAVAISQKPADPDFAKALEPTGKQIQEVISYRETHRTSPLFNHLSAISESISGLSWVAIAPTPGPYVKELGEAAMFYTNRVLKDFRDKDKTHVTWVQNYNEIFKELQAYIKEYHTTGVSFNAKGGSLLSNLGTVSGGSAGGGAGGVPPPPPGGVPPPPPLVNLQPKAVVDDGRGKLFEDINKGLDITSSLKKVADDQKTHKNPSLREGPRPFVKAADGKPSSTFTPAPTQKPPRIALEGKKWYVEYQKDNNNVVLDNCKMDHSVYIFKCENTVVQVKGKVNSVILDSCKKSSVVYDSLVCACEIVNCQSCQMQVMGKVATIAIEKTDGCQVFLSKEALNVEIITAKSSEMNVLIPNNEGEFEECPVPEQFKTVIKGNKLFTTVTEKD